MDTEGGPDAHGSTKLGESNLTEDHTRVPAARSERFLLRPIWCGITHGARQAWLTSEVALTMSTRCSQPPLGVSLLLWRARPP